MASIPLASAPEVDDIVSNPRAHIGQIADEHRVLQPGASTSRRWASVTAEGSQADPAAARRSDQLRDTFGDGRTPKSATTSRRRPRGGAAPRRSRIDVEALTHAHGSTSATVDLRLGFSPCPRKSAETVLRFEPGPHYDHPVCRSRDVLPRGSAFEGEQLECAVRGTPSSVAKCR